MNSFGRFFRVTLFGESHGPSVGLIIDGCPAGLALDADEFFTDLERRKGGLQKGTTPRKEDDHPRFLSGVFNGHTTGSPIAIVFENSNTRSADYDKIRSIPRPGHADFTAHQKFGGFEDYRGGGHFSGRLTVCLVAAGVVAKKILSGQKIEASVREIGGDTDLEKGLQKAIDANDSVGGIVECKVTGLPAGVGSPFFDSLESLISHAAFSIPAIKGIEFGAGFAAANMFGSQHNDSIMDASGATETNHSGGINGGLSNGNELVFRIVVKPASSTPAGQVSFNTDSGQVEKFAVQGRHDLCIALRVPPVLEAITAMVLTDLMMQEGRISTVIRPV